MFVAGVGPPWPINKFEFAAVFVPRIKKFSELTVRCETTKIVNALLTTEFVIFGSNTSCELEVPFQTTQLD